MTHYRNQGAIGALLDEYEKAVVELEKVLAGVTDEELSVILDHETTDPNCRSFQTILSHVIKAGYCYVIEIRRSLGEQIDFVDLKTLNTVQEYILELRNMFRYNERLFNDYPAIQLEEHNPEKKIPVQWGQQYDVEQLMEHAIVHILRHRRQIQRFLLTLN